MRKRRVMKVNDFLKYKPESFKGGVYRISKNASIDDNTGNNRTVGLIHPAGGIVTRKQHGMFTYTDDDKLKWAGFACIGKHCPICMLSEFADYIVSEDEDFRSEPVLACKDNQIGFAHLIGGKNVDYRLKICDRRDQVVLLWVPIGPEFDSAQPARMMIECKAVLMGLQKMIAEQISDCGDEGDPLATPYVISMSYNPNAKSAAEKYSVSRPHGRIAKITDEVQCVLDMELDELEVKSPGEFCEHPPVEKIMETLSKSWLCEDVSFDDYQSWYDEKCGVSPKKKLKKAKAKLEKTEDADVVFCSECKDDVVPDADGDCPECGSSLDSEEDIPF